MAYLWLLLAVTEKHSRVRVRVMEMREISAIIIVVYCRQCFHKNHFFIIIFFFQVMPGDCKIAIARLVLILKM